MLQAILEMVLSPERQQPQVDSGDPGDTMNALTDERLEEQTWLSANLDMDFWTSLEDHPLLAWPELTESA